MGFYLQMFTKRVRVVGHCPDTRRESRPQEGLPWRRHGPIQAGRRTRATKRPADERGVGRGREPAPRPASGSDSSPSAGNAPFTNTHAFTPQRTVDLSSEDHLSKRIHACACSRLLIKGDEQQH